MRFFGQTIGKTAGRNGSNGGNGTGTNRSGYDLAGVQSEPTPEERGQPLPQTPSFGEDHDLVEMVNERAKACRAQRRVAEREWTLAVAMYEDRQWLAWDETAHQAISMVYDDEIDRYVTHNLIRPLIDQLCGMATKSKPDASPAPKNDSPMSRAAAAEARAITAHLWRKHDRPMQMLDLVWWASVCGLVYLKDNWNPDGMADIAELGPDGSVQGEVSAMIGEVDSEVVPPYTILVDPRARRWKKAAWIIEDTVEDLGEAEERYDTVIEPDADADGNWFDSYLPEGSRFGGVSSLGPFQMTPGTKRAVRVRTLYEKPTKRFPSGRMIAVTKSRVLYKGPMPLKDKHRFPFSRLVFQEAAAHPYGLGIVRSLSSIQIEYNKYCTKVLNHIVDSKDTIITPKGASMGADAFIDDVEDKRSYRRVYWDSQAGVPPPEYMIPPNITADVWKAKENAWIDMQHIAGIHDVSDGNVPKSVSSGVAIELLQESDRTQLGLFTQRIEQFAVDRDELDIMLYAQYAAGNVPRMMSIDDTGNPQKARTQVQAFRALTGGGSVEVVVRPGSAIPKSMAGKTQEIYDRYNMGLYNPQNPAAQIANRLLDDVRSDEIQDMILEMQEQMLAALKEEQANQPPPPNPTQAETIKQQGETQRLQMKLEGETTKQQQATQAQFALNSQKAQLDMLLATTKANTEVRAKAIEQSVSHAASIREEIAKTALEMHAAKHAPAPKMPGLKKKG